MSRIAFAWVLLLVVAGCGGGAAASGQRTPADSAKAAKADSLRRLHEDSLRMVGGRMPSDTVPPTDYAREVYRYRGAARDPFETLLSSSDVRPMIDDLRLVSVIYDPRYGNSLAVVRELRGVGDSIVHRLRRGARRGRLQVMQILPYEVRFQLQEFGLNRDTVLRLRRPGEDRR